MSTLDRASAHTRHLRSQSKSELVNKRKKKNRKKVLSDGIYSDECTHARSTEVLCIESS